MSRDDNKLNPERLFRTNNAFWASCALHAAVKLELFTRLGSEIRTASSLAKEIGADERRLGALLDAMVAMELLNKSDAGYSVTPMSATFLSKDSPKYIGFIIMHNHHLVDSWRRLDEAVLEGRPVRLSVSEGEENIREAFLMGMFNVASELAREWAPQFDLSGRRRCLDIGGGPGTWSIFLCRENPELEATVFDLPTTRPFAEKTIARFGLDDRVRFRGGDYNSDDLGVGHYDVVLLSHILHSEGPEACRSLLGRAVASLEPGGLIMVHEFLLDDDLTSPLFPALFSLNMAVGTESGRAYSVKQLTEMLSALDVVEIERLPLTSHQGSAFLVGKKKQKDQLS